MYKDGGFVRAEMWGSVLAVTSTVGAATYQVLRLDLCSSDMEDQCGHI